MIDTTGSGTGRTSYVVLWSYTGAPGYLDPPEVEHLSIKVQAISHLIFDVYVVLRLLDGVDHGRVNAALDVVDPGAPT